MKSICVYCSSSQNIDPIYIEEVKKIGRFLAENNFHLVYGGAKMGCMGALANSALAHGGQVTGVVPLVFQKQNFAHKELTNIHYEKNMYDRKKKMFQHSDAFLIFPGGLGTMDEALEALCYNQIKVLNKPVIFYDFQNFWSPLMKYLDEVKEKKIINVDLKSLYEIYNSFEEICQRLKEI